MIKAVLFDLDGTLVNSIADLATSTNEALREFGFPTHNLEKYKYFVGNGMAKLIARAMPENEITDEKYNAVYNSFMAHYRLHFTDKTKPYDGIEELLLNLRTMGLKLAVVSNKSQEMSEKVVEALLPNVFSAVCGKKEGYSAKPDPTLTLMTMKELGIKPEECVFVGDSGMDMAVAVNSGSYGIGVLWGFRAESELMENGAKFIVDKPLKIAKIIEDLNK